MRALPVLLLALATLAACDNGNIRPTTSYNALKAPAVRNPTYNFYAAYGEANATWAPPTYNRDGTVVKPAEPHGQPVQAAAAPTRRPALSKLGLHPALLTGGMITSDRGVMSPLTQAVVSIAAVLS